MTKREMWKLGSECASDESKTCEFCGKEVHCYFEINEDWDRHSCYKCFLKQDWEIKGE